MTATKPRPVAELAAGSSPLAGAEQQVLREWIAEWVFCAQEFSSLAQPLIRGDRAALEQAYAAQVQQYQEQGQTLEESRRSVAAHYEDMRETALRMPAMEVVIAGAQYFAGCRSAAAGHSRAAADYGGCLRVLGAMGVSVDAQDVAGFTAFMRASQTSHSRLDLAQELLRLGADVNHRSRFGGVALHEALMAQDRHAVAFLKRNGAEMDIRDNDGVSPRDIVALIL
ncbi:hypothetical protein GGI07_001682 [Coemansia sp. Benny D115]|nr:hypothetical protein GGI07_001682 [Coemansia sp. Benny D115]